MKKLISLLLAIVLCLSLTSGLFAFADGSSDDAPGFSASGSDPMRLEETQWYFRETADGLLQMRLWSITYGYWKTDWITYGHV